MINHHKNIGEPADTVFKIRPYGKKELAMLYFPQAKSKTIALKKLRRWIHYNHQLHEELYNGPEGRNDWYFSVRQVKVLIKYLEEP